MWLFLSQCLFSSSEGQKNKTADQSLPKVVPDDAHQKHSANQKPLCKIGAFAVDCECPEGYKVDNQTNKCVEPYIGTSGENFKNTTSNHYSSSQHKKSNGKENLPSTSQKANKQQSAEQNDQNSSQSGNKELPTKRQENNKKSYPASPARDRKAAPCATGADASTCTCASGFYVTRNTNLCIKCTANFECAGDRTALCLSADAVQLSPGHADTIMADFRCSPTLGLVCGAGYMLEEATGYGCAACKTGTTCDGSFDVKCGALNVNLFLAIFDSTYLCSGGAAGVLTCRNTSSYMSANYRCVACTGGLFNGFTCDGSQKLTCGGVPFDTVQARVDGQSNAEELTCAAAPKGIHCTNATSFYLLAGVCTACPRFATCDGSAYLGPSGTTTNVCSGEGDVCDGKPAKFCGAFPDCAAQKLCNNAEVITTCKCPAGHFTEEKVAGAAVTRTCYKCPDGFACDGSPVFSCGPTEFNGVEDALTIWKTPATPADALFSCAAGRLACVEQTAGTKLYINKAGVNPVCKTCPIGRTCDNSAVLGCRPFFDCFVGVDPAFLSAMRCKSDSFRAVRDFALTIVADPDKSLTGSTTEAFINCAKCAETPTAPAGDRAQATLCNGANVTQCANGRFPNSLGDTCVLPCAVVASGADPATCYCGPGFYLSNATAPDKPLCFEQPLNGVGDGSSKVVCTTGGQFTHVSGAAPTTLCNCKNGDTYEVTPDKKCECVPGFYQDKQVLTNLKCITCPVGFLCIGTEKVTCENYVDHQGKKSAIIPVANLADFVCENRGSNNGARCKPTTATPPLERLLVNTKTAAFPVVDQPELACIACPVNYICNGSRALKCENQAFDQAFLVPMANMNAPVATPIDLKFVCNINKTFECGPSTPPSTEFLKKLTPTAVNPFVFECVACTGAPMFDQTLLTCNGSRFASCGTDFTGMSEDMLMTNQCIDKAGAGKLLCVKQITTPAAGDPLLYLDLGERRCKPCPLGFKCDGTIEVLCGAKIVSDFANFTCADPYLICKAVDSSRVYLQNTACVPCPKNFNCNGTDVVTCGPDGIGARVFDLENISCDINRTDGSKHPICNKAVQPNSIIVFNDPLYTCQKCEGSFSCDQRFNVICPTFYGDVKIPHLQLSQFTCVEDANNSNRTTVVCPKANPADNFSMFVPIPASQCLACGGGFACNGSNLVTCGVLNDPAAPLFSVLAENATEMICVQNRPRCSAANQYVDSGVDISAPKFSCQNCPPSWSCDGSENLICNNLQMVQSYYRENFTCNASKVLRCKIDGLSNLSSDPAVPRVCTKCHENFTCEPAGPVKCGSLLFTNFQGFFCLNKAVSSSGCVKTDAAKCADLLLNDDTCALDELKYLNVSNNAPICENCPANYKCDGMETVKCGGVTLQDLVNGPGLLKCEADQLMCINSGLLFLAENQSCQACPMLDVNQKFLCNGGPTAMCGLDKEKFTEFVDIQCKTDPSSGELKPTCAGPATYLKNGTINESTSEFESMSFCTKCPEGFQCDGTRVVKCGDAMLNEENLSTFRCENDAVDPTIKILSCRDPSKFLFDTFLNVDHVTFHCVACLPGFTCNGTAVMRCGTDTEYVEVRQENLTISAPQFECLLKELICLIQPLENYLDLTLIPTPPTPITYAPQCKPCPLGFRCDGTRVVRCGEVLINKDGSGSLIPFQIGEFNCTVKSTLVCADVGKLLIEINGKPPRCGSCGTFSCLGTSQLFCGSTQMPVNLSDSDWLPRTLICRFDDLECLDSVSSGTSKPQYRRGLECFQCPTKGVCLGVVENCCNETNTADCGFLCDNSEKVLCGGKEVPLLDLNFYNCIKGVLTCPMDGSSYDSGVTNTICKPCPAGFKCDGSKTVQCESRILTDFVRFTCSKQQNKLFCASPSQFYLELLPPPVHCLQCPFGFACTGLQEVKCGALVVSSDRFADLGCLNGDLVCADAAKIILSRQCNDCPSGFTCNGSASAMCGPVALTEYANFSCAAEILSCIDANKYVNGKVCQDCPEGFSCSGSPAIKCGDQVMSEDIEAFLCVDGVLKCKDEAQYLSGLVCVACPFAFKCDGSFNKANVLTLRVGLIIGGLVLLIIIAIVLTVVLYCKRKDKKVIAQRSDQAIREVQEWEVARDNQRILKKTGKFDVLSDVLGESTNVPGAAQLAGTVVGPAAASAVDNVINVGAVLEEPGQIVMTQPPADGRGTVDGDQEDATSAVLIF